MPTFYNQATLSFNDNEIPSNIVTGQYNEVIFANKASMQTSYKTGDTITYILTITNNGTTDMTGLTVNDNLGTYTTTGTPALTLTPLTYVNGSVLYYSGGTLQSAPTVVIEQDKSVTFSTLSVPAGSIATLIYQANVNEYAPLVATSSITNTASIFGGTIATPINVSTTLPVSTEPVLSISKSVCPDTVTDNGQITYTFLIMNRGNRAIVGSDNVTISDTFDPVLSNLSVTFTDYGSASPTPVTWSENTNYTYTNGTFTSIAGNITVPAATYTQDATTGAITITPGTSVLKISGTI